MAVYLHSYSRWVAILFVSCLFPCIGLSQTGDTTTTNLVVPNSLFGTMGIPADILDGNLQQSNAIMMPQHNKFLLYKALELPSQNKAFGRPDKPILNIKFYNPRTDLPYAVYAALRVGEFFNHQHWPIPKAQEMMIMNDIYKRPDLDVSGFKEQYPANIPNPNRVIP